MAQHEGGRLRGEVAAVRMVQAAFQFWGIGVPRERGADMAAGRFGATVRGLQSRNKQLNVSLSEARKLDT